jgi:PAS domain S-box-containing protein
MMATAMTDQPSINISPDQFETLFPFHIAIDRSLVIRKTGHSLLRVCPDAIPGVYVPDVFNIQMPETVLDFDAIQKTSSQLHVWRHHENDLILRGEIVLQEQDGLLVFLASPWLTSNAELTRYGLSLSDFALHDPVVDLLQVLQAQKMALEDAKALADKVSKQKAEYARANKALNDQYHLLASTQKQLKLKEEETRKLALVASRTDNAVVITDAQGRVEWVNEGFTRVTGYAFEEIKGKRPGDVLQGPNTDPETKKYIAQQLAEKKGFTAELINYTKSGQEYWLHIEVQPIFDALGEITNFMAIESDITERKESEAILIAAKQNAEEASQAKSAFLAAMSHEIRSPMNAILGTLELLEGSNLGGELVTLIQTCRSSANWLLSVVNDILDFSKIESGMFSLHPDIFEFNALVYELQGLFFKRAHDKGLMFLVQVDPKIPPMLRGDATRLRQILVNLLNNAIKFTDKGQVELSVELKSNRDSVVDLFFSVRDTGIGIRPEDQGKLFREFAQVESGDTRSYGGSGLGLVICKRLIELMGGEMGIESEFGRGSRFWLVLPVEVWHQPLADDRNRQSLVEHKDIHPPAQILLVDDGEANRLVIETFLKRAGHRVVAAGNGQDAVRIAGEQRFDVILMDVQMPVMGGIEATRRIRKLAGPSRGVPIVALTANALAGNQEACLEAGMNAFVTKPISNASLLDVIRPYLPSVSETARKETLATEELESVSSTLDESLLASLIADTDEETALMVIGMYFAEAKDHAEKIRKGIIESDRQLLREESHALRSGAKLVGAVQLAQTLQSLEECCVDEAAEMTVELAHLALAQMDAVREVFVKKGMIKGM